MVSSEATSPLSAQTQQVTEVDLTEGFQQPDLPIMRRNQVRSSPRSFNAAVRRVYSRRERMYDQRSPGIMHERLDIAEECPAPVLHPAREKALTHLSRAYAVAGYAQAALCVVFSAVLVAFVLSFARGFLSDISRKTRARAGDSVRAASICAQHYQENMCATLDRSKLTPAMSNMCLEWQECVDRGTLASQDAVSATVWAEAAAEAVNAFAEKISSTTILVGLISCVVLTFFMSSAAFGFMHRRLIDDRLTAVEPSPAPSVLSRNEEGISSPFVNNSLRPRAITFDPNTMSPPKTITDA